jgi:hypothetical protein
MTCRSGTISRSVRRTLVMRSASMRMTSSSCSGRDGLVVARRIERRIGVVAAAIARDDPRELAGRNLVGALEHHVFEKMRGAGMAERLIGAADLVDDDLGDDRGTPRRQHDDLQPVDERKGLGVAFADGEKLRERRSGRREGRAREEAAEQGAAAGERHRTQKMPSSRPRLRRVMVGVGPAAGCPEAWESRMRCCSLAGSTITPGGGESCQKIRLSMKRLVALGQGLGVGIDLSPDVGVDAALSGAGDQRLLCAAAGSRCIGSGIDAGLGAAGQCRRQRFLRLVGGRDFLRTRLARPRAAAARHWAAWSAANARRS